MWSMFADALHTGCWNGGIATVGVGCYLSRLARLLLAASVLSNGSDRIPKTVLVVEDEFDIAGVLGTFLTTEGYDVVYASDGEEGLAALIRKPDLVLVDAIMPRLGGPEMVQAMRADPKQASIPIMMMSALPDMPDADVPMVRKPFEIEELLQKIETLIGRP